MEECPEKSLYLRLADKDRIPAEKARTWTEQVLKGVAILQELSIAHRFLKPHHVLFSADEEVKLSGWSRAVYFGAGNQAKEPKSFKNNHLPPECFKGHYDPSRVDVWSVGALMVNIATGRYAFDVSALDDTKMSMQWRRFMEQHEINDYVRSCCNECFCIDPIRRVTAEKLLKHGYFSAKPQELAPTRRAKKDSKSGNYDSHFSMCLGQDDNVEQTTAAVKSSSLGGGGCSSSKNNKSSSAKGASKWSQSSSSKGGGGPEPSVQVIGNESKASKHYPLHSRIKNAVRLDSNESTVSALKSRAPTGASKATTKPPTKLALKSKSSSKKKLKSASQRPKSSQGKSQSKTGSKITGASIKNPKSITKGGGGGSMKRPSQVKSSSNRPKSVGKQISGTPNKKLNTAAATGASMKSNNAKGSKK